MIFSKHSNHPQYERLKVEFNLRLETYPIGRRKCKCQCVQSEKKKPVTTISKRGNSVDIVLLRKTGKPIDTTINRQPAGEQNILNKKQCTKRKMQDKMGQSTQIERGTAIDKITSIYNSCFFYIQQ